nr:MAG TPA: hypothetical protein [Caudoviricetes sp.]
MTWEEYAKILLGNKKIGKQNLKDKAVLSIKQWYI